MKSLSKALLFGFLVWLIPFVVSVAIFPLKKANPPLFESVMPVTLTVCAAVFAGLYYRSVERRFLREGVLLGVLWLLMNLALDFPLFHWGPMAMPVTRYVSDIGLTYLIFPAFTIGAGAMLERAGGQRR